MSSKSHVSENSRMMAALSYLLGPITAVVFLMIEKKDSYVRFHAMQSLITFGALFIIYVILTFTIVGLVLLPLLLIFQFILWIMLMYKAFTGEKYQLPYVGKFAVTGINKK